jgi:FtsZ-binding cell division protein ZapB
MNASPVAVTPPAGVALGCTMLGCRELFEALDHCEEILSKQGKEDLERSRRVIELTERFEKSVQESVDDIMSFKKDFHEYKETKEQEVTRLEETYGKLIRETVERVDNFEQQITLNVGGMLKDLNDIKLQLTSGGSQNLDDKNLLV